MLTADGRARTGFLRAHRISGEDLEAAAEAFDAEPESVDDEPSAEAFDEEGQGLGEAPQAESSVHSDEPTANADALDDAEDSDGHGVEPAPAEIGSSAATTQGDGGTKSRSPGSPSTSGADRQPSSANGDAASDQGEQDRTRASGPAARLASTSRRGSTVNVEEDESRFYSYVVARGSREARMAERAESEAMRVGALGVEHVVAFEARFGRTAVPQNHSNTGFDVISARPDGTDRRIIEVKATARTWPSRGIPVSKHQIAKNVESGDQFWLYVVEFATESQQAKVIPIQNPVAAVDYFVFDAGWEKRADNSGDEPDG